MRDALDFGAIAAKLYHIPCDKCLLLFVIPCDKCLLLARFMHFLNNRKKLLTTLEISHIMTMMI